MAFIALAPFLASLLNIRPADGGAALFLRVDGEQAGVELAVALRLFIPPGQARP